ncbi:MAG: hypothetical protein ACLS23_06545 [Clostridioides difficile]
MLWKRINDQMDSMLERDSSIRKPRKTIWQYYGIYGLENAHYLQDDMTTYERYFIADKKTQEKKPYYILREDEKCTNFR